MELLVGGEERGRGGMKVSTASLHGAFLEANRRRPLIYPWRETFGSHERRERGRERERETENFYGSLLSI